jgi:secreted trypsin-like serine protease
LASYTAPRYGYDIALVKLARDWTGPLSKLSASTDQDPHMPLPEDENVMVAGFGSTDMDANDLLPLTRANGEKFFASTAELLEVALPLVEPLSCQQAWPGAAIGVGQLCAGFTEVKGKDSCNGDSGGPLVAFDGKLCPRQIGLVSWGASPCAPGDAAYGIYTRVSNFAEWIRDTMARHQ